MKTCTKCGDRVYRKTSAYCKACRAKTELGRRIRLRQRDHVKIPKRHRCSKCKKLRLAKFFHKNPSALRGLQGWCRKCSCAPSNLEKKKVARIIKLEKEPAYELFRSAKSRAVARGLPFTIKLEDIIIPSHCPVLGIPLFRNKGKTSTDNSPTLERLIPELGYTKENVRVISWKANRIKNDATWQELKSIYLYFKKEVKKLENNS